MMSPCQYLAATCRGGRPPKLVLMGSVSHPNALSVSWSYLRSCCFFDVSHIYCSLDIIDCSATADMVIDEESQQLFSSNETPKNT